jgi:hypothetical protein
MNRALFLLALLGSCARTVPHTAPQSVPLGPIRHEHALQHTASPTAVPSPSMQQAPPSSLDSRLGEIQNAVDIEAAHVQQHMKEK